MSTCAPLLVELSCAKVHSTTVVRIRQEMTNNLDGTLTNRLVIKTQNTKRKGFILPCIAGDTVDGDSRRCNERVM